MPNNLSSCRGISDKLCRITLHQGRISPKECPISEKQKLYFDLIPVKVRMLLANLNEVANRVIVRDDNISYDSHGGFIK